MRINGYSIGEKYWKKSHGCYFLEIRHLDQRRETRRLDPDADKAEAIRAEIITKLRKAGTVSADYGVRDLCFLFLDHAKANNSLKTYKCYRSFIASFCSTIPAALRVRELKLHHVQNWLKRFYPATGNTNTRHNAVATLKRVFNWAVNDMEYLDHSPLVRMKKPPKVPRGTCLSKAQWAEVLARYLPDDPFYDFLYILIHTGCRPQEARILEARHIDWQTGVAQFKDGEVPGKKGDRQLRLTRDAAAVLQRWALKYPKGPVLRNTDGRPWTPTAISSRFQRLKSGPRKLPFKVHAYVARHSAAVELLEAGASAGAVAAILGHKDATMVLRVYGKHIEQREQHLREHLERGLG
jgi:integrase